VALYGYAALLAIPALLFIGWIAVLNFLRNRVDAKIDSPDDAERTTDNVSPPARHSSGA
jgi:hypothetical protein